MINILLELLPLFHVIHKSRQWPSVWIGKRPTSKKSREFAVVKSHWQTAILKFVANNLQLRGKVFQRGPNVAYIKKVEAQVVHCPTFLLIDCRDYLQRLTPTIKSTYRQLNMLTVQGLPTVCEINFFRIVNVFTILICFKRLGFFI